MMKIALNECVNMRGRDLVIQRKDSCCCACSISNASMFEYNFGMDIEEKPYKMGDESPMDFYAFVTVDPETGKCRRDYKNSKLPRK